MAKLFKQQKAEIRDNKTIREISDIVMKGFDYPEPTPFQKAVMKLWGLFLGIGIFMIVFVIVGVANGWLWLTALGLIFSAAGWIFMFIGRYQKSRYKVLVSKLMTGKQNQIYELWFEKNYDDIKVDGGIDQSRISVAAHSYRGAGIPGDARVSSFVPGYRMKCTNGAIIETAVINWRWTRSNGKTSTTYYRKRVYFIVEGYKDNFKDFQLSFAKNGIFNKARKELENEKFNKTWIYNHNDPVKLRMLFTPSVQEEVLNNISNQTFELNKFDNFFFASHEVPQANSVFVMNTRGSVDYSNKQAIANNFVTDVIADIDNFQEWLLEVSVFRTLFKTI